MSSRPPHVAPTAEEGTGGVARSLAPRDLVDLTKPGIVAMAAVTALLGYALGAEGSWEPLRLLLALVGIVLVGGGGNALNMVMERDADARMVRTRERPLPAGRMETRQAVLFGAALATTGWAILLFGTNHLTALLAAFTCASYLFLYTPLKELTPWNTMVGAVPGALPPVLGWAAATNRLGLGAAVLFGILFFWQVPHFLPLAWLHRKDYEAGGFRMISKGDATGRRTAWVAAIFCLPLLAVSLLPGSLGWTGPVYLLGAAAAGLGFLALAGAFVADRTDLRARRLFLYSLLYLPAVLGLLTVDALTDLL